MTKNMRFPIRDAIGAACLLVLAGCSTSSGFSLPKLPQGRAVSTGSSAVIAGLRSSMPEQSSAQKQQIEQQLASRNGASAPGVAEARQAAAPLIQKILRVTACGQTTSVESQLAGDTAPGYTATMFMSAQMNMPNHPKGYCTSVSRLDSWAMEARNVLRFRAVYTSDHSGESLVRSYGLMRQPDGQWLIRDVRFGY